MATNYDELGNVINSDDGYTSSDVERKTKKSNATPNKNYYSTVSAGKNILNSYRSVNYNFTLAAISAYQANRPENYDLKNPKYIVATSKGKNKNDRANSLGASANTPITKRVQDDIAAFNKDTPGSFDLFIDDVNIDSTFSFKEGAVTLPLKFDFDVIEPYSLNGFIESLQICALASGFSDYIKAGYVLILDFIGIPDVGDTPLPEPVPNSSKVFFIRITGIQVSVTDSGTKYKVSAVALSETARGNAVSKTKRKLVGKGNTIKELLTDVVKGMNEHSSNEAKSSSSKQTMFDSYEILFPVYNEKGEIIPGRDNEIASEKFWDDLAAANSNVAMNEIGAAPSAYQPAGSGAKNPPKQESQSTLTHKHTAQFDSGVPITDIISSTIRDSNYVKKVIKAFQSNGNVQSVLDSNGFLNYFIITPKIVAKDGPDNPATKQPYYTYTYLVEVYKVLYNMAVPGAGNYAIDVKKIQNYALRNYRYFYTGLNTDILDFKINLNNLFFEEIPASLGNNEADSSADSAKSSNSTNTRAGEPGTKNIGSSVPQYSTNNSSSANYNDMPNSTAPDGTGWQQSVKIMHEKIANSVGLISGDLSILGDPYYLTATGSGNSLNKNSEFGKLANGQEAAVRAGMVLISLAFNNPDDIDQSGFMKFNNNPLPIGGLYQITLVKSKFKDGIFRQDLSILRVPGQSIDKQPDDASKIYSSYPNPEDQTSKSSGPVSNSDTITTNDSTIGTRADSLNLESVVNRLSLNYPGGLGGNNNPVFGAINPANGYPTAIYGTVPNGVNQLATGIRASASGLYAAQNSKLGDASLAVGTAKIFNTLYPNTQISAVTDNLINNQRELKYTLSNNSLNAAASNPAGLIGNVNNQINSAINGVANDLQGVAKLFGIVPSLVSGITGNINSKVLSSLNGLSNLIPANVNLKTASNQGIKIDGLSPTGLSKLPPLPTPPVGIKNAGFAGIDNLNNSFNNVLNNPQFSQIDDYARSQRENSAFSLYGKLSGNPLPVDSNYNTFNQNQDVAKSVVSQYGSRSKNEISPLVNALNNNIA